MSRRITQAKLFPDGRQKFQMLQYPEQLNGDAGASWSLGPCKAPSTMASAIPLILNPEPIYPNCPKPQILIILITHRTSLQLHLQFSGDRTQLSPHRPPPGPIESTWVLQELFGGEEALSLGCII